MIEFNVKDIEDKEFLTPAVRRYLDRMLDVEPTCRRSIKIKRINDEDNLINIIVLVESGRNDISVAVYEMRYHARETLEATLNSPALVKVTDIYDPTQAKEVWESV